MRRVAASIVGMYNANHIVLVGPMGAGKTSIGRLLAARLQRAFIDLDALIEAEAGASISHIFANAGEAEFRMRECSALASALASPTVSVIATGGGVVLEAGNRALMRDAACVVCLQVDPVIQLQRLRGDTTRPLLATADPAQRLAELQAQREPLYRDVAHVVFDTSLHTPASAADSLAAMLAPAMERLA